MLLLLLPQLIVLIFIYLLWCIYCYVFLHFVSEWHKPPCRRFVPGSMRWNSSFKFIVSLIFLTRRYSIEAFILMVAPHQPYSSSWSTTFLVKWTWPGASIEAGRYSWYQSHIRNKCRILTMNLNRYPNLSSLGTLPLGFDRVLGPVISYSASFWHRCFHFRLRWLTD